MTCYRIGVVGAGRVGSVLAAALRAVGHDVVAVSGTSAATATRVETLLPGVPLLRPEDVAGASELLLLTVPDDSLADLATALARVGSVSPGQHVVHTSGRHGTAVLAPLTALGARVAAMHPAMTFTGTDVDLDRLPGCVFGVTAAPDLRRLVDALTTDLRAETVWIEEADRPLYHAALAHGANHLVTLVVQAMELLRSAGVVGPARTLRPLLAATLDNALDYGDAALTGPIVRGDKQTVAAHVRLLAEVSPQARTTYAAMGRTTVQRAVADGRLTPAVAAAITEVLTEPLVGGPLVTPA